MADRAELSLVLAHELWAHAKGIFTPAELRIKQAVWEWFSSLPPQALEQIFTITDQHWVEYVLRLEKLLQARPNQTGVFLDFENINKLSARSAGDARGQRRKSLPGRQPHFKSAQSTLSNADLPLFRTWASIEKEPLHSISVSPPAPPQVSEAYRRSSEDLRAGVRVGDSAVARDTFTLESSLLCDHARIWSLLDDVSLHAFATTLPPPLPASLSAASPHNNAEMTWFATVNVFTLGAFVANRLELALMSRFRQWAESNGTLARIKGASSSAELVSATFPGAYPAATTGAAAAPTDAALAAAGKPKPASPHAAGATRAAAGVVSPVARSPPASGGGLGLMSKSHLAVFWDGLSATERLKIVLGDSHLGPSLGAVGGPGSSGLSPTQLLWASSSSSSVGGGKPGTPVAWPDPLAGGGHSGGGSSSKSVSGGKQSKRRGGAHSGAGRSSAPGWGSLLGGGSSHELRKLALSELPAASAGGGGQDTLGPLPTLETIAKVTKSGRQGPTSTLPHGVPGGMQLDGRAVAAAGAAGVASSASGAGSGSTSSDTVTYLTAATLLASDASGRQSEAAGGSCTFEAGSDGHHQPASSGAGGSSARAGATGGPTVLGSSSGGAVAAASVGIIGRDSTGVLQAHSSALSESCATELDESTAHSVGTLGGTGPLPPSDLFNQDISQLMGMWPFSLVEKDGLSVVQDLYLSTLARAAAALPDAGALGGSSSTGPEGEQARSIGYRLQCSWADTHAMDLIVAEDEARVSTKSSSGGGGMGHSRGIGRISATDVHTPSVWPPSSARSTSSATAAPGNQVLRGSLAAGKLHQSAEFHGSIASSIAGSARPLASSAASAVEAALASAATKPFAASFATPSQLLVPAAELSSHKSTSPPPSPTALGSSIAAWLASPAAEAAVGPSAPSWDSGDSKDGKKKARKKGGNTVGKSAEVAGPVSSTAVSTGADQSIASSRDAFADEEAEAAQYGSRLRASSADVLVQGSSAAPAVSAVASVTSSPVVIAAGSSHPEQSGAASSSLAASGSVDGEPDDSWQEPQAGRRSNRKQKSGSSDTMSTISASGSSVSRLQFSPKRGVPVDKRSGKGGASGTSKPTASGAAHLTEKAGGSFVKASSAGGAAHSAVSEVPATAQEKRLSVGSGGQASVPLPATSIGGATLAPGVALSMMTFAAPELASPAALSASRKTDTAEDARLAASSPLSEAPSPGSITARSLSSPVSPPRPSPGIALGERGKASVSTGGVAADGDPVVSRPSWVNVTRRAVAAPPQLPPPSVSRSTSAVAVATAAAFPAPLTVGPASTTLAPSPRPVSPKSAALPHGAAAELTVDTDRAPPSSLQPAASLVISVSASDDRHVVPSSAAAAAAAAWASVIATPSAAVVSTVGSHESSEDQQNVQRIAAESALALTVPRAAIPLDSSASGISSPPAVVEPAPITTTASISHNAADSAATSPAAADSVVVTTPSVPAMSISAYPSLPSTSRSAQPKYVATAKASPATVHAKSDASTVQASLERSDADPARGQRDKKPDGTAAAVFSTGSSSTTPKLSFLAAAQQKADAAAQLRPAAALPRPAPSTLDKTALLAGPALAAPSPRILPPTPTVAAVQPVLVPVAVAPASNVAVTAQGHGLTTVSSPVGTLAVLISATPESSVVPAEPVAMVPDAVNPGLLVEHASGALRSELSEREALGKATAVSQKESNHQAVAPTPPSQPDFSSAAAAAAKASPDRVAAQKAMLSSLSLAEGTAGESLIPVVSRALAAAASLTAASSVTSPRSASVSQPPSAAAAAAAAAAAVGSGMSVAKRGGTVQKPELVVPGTAHNRSTAGAASLQQQQQQQRPRSPSIASHTSSQSTSSVQLQQIMHQHAGATSAGGGGFHNTSRTSASQQASGGRHALLSTKSAGASSPAWGGQSTAATAAAGAPVSAGSGARQRTGGTSGTLTPAVKPEKGAARPADTVVPGSSTAAAAAKTWGALAATMREEAAVPRGKMAAVTGKATVAVMATPPQDAASDLTSPTRPPSPLASVAASLPLSEQPSVDCLAVSDVTRSPSSALGRDAKAAVAAPPQSTGNSSSAAPDDSPVARSGSSSSGSVDVSVLAPVARDESGSGGFSASSGDLTPAGDAEVEAASPAETTCAAGLTSDSLPVSENEDAKGDGEADDAPSAGDEKASVGSAEAAEPAHDEAVRAETAAEAGLPSATEEVQPAGMPSGAGADSANRPGDPLVRAELAPSSQDAPTPPQASATHPYLLAAGPGGPMAAPAVMQPQQGQWAVAGMPLQSYGPAPMSQQFPVGPAASILSQGMSQQQLHQMQQQMFFQQQQQQQQMMGAVGGMRVGGGLPIPAGFVGFHQPQGPWMLVPQMMPPGSPGQLPHQQAPPSHMGHSASPHQQQFQHHKQQQHQHQQMHYPQAQGFVQVPLHPGMVASPQYLLSLAAVPPHYMSQYGGSVMPHASAAMSGQMLQPRHRHFAQPPQALPAPSPSQLRQPSPLTGLPLWLEYQLHAELSKLHIWAVAHAHFRRMQELRVVWDVARLVVEGLATPTSDVDVLIKNATVAHLSLLAKSLKSQPWISSVVAVPTARVPVIRLLAEPPPIESLPQSTSVLASDGTVLLGGGPPQQPARDPRSSPSLRSRSDGGPAVPTASLATAAASSGTELSSGGEGSTGPLPPPLQRPRSSSGRGDSGQGELSSSPKPGSTASPRMPPRRGSMSGSLGASPPFSLLSSRGSSGDLAATGSDANDRRRGSLGLAAATVAASGARPGSPAVSGGSGAGSATSRVATVALPGGWFDSKAPIRLDITFENEAHRGNAATNLTRWSVGSNASLAPLVLALKHLLTTHGLNDAFTGGLSSFGLLVLTSGFLHHAAREALPGVVQGQRGGQTAPFTAFATPEQPLQPSFDSRTFSEVVLPYAMLPPELCGNVHDLKRDMLLPLPMPRLPPVLPPYTRVVRARRGGAARLRGGSSSTRRAGLPQATGGGGVSGEAAGLAPGNSSSGSSGSAASTHLSDEPSRGEAPRGLSADPAVSREPASSAHEGSRAASDSVPTVVEWDAVIQGTPDAAADVGLTQPSLGVLFLRLLQYAADELSPATTAMTVTGPVPVAARGAAVVTDPVTIIDPIDGTSNVGRNCFRFGQVQHVLRDAWAALAALAASPPASLAIDSLATRGAAEAVATASPAASVLLPVSREFPVLSAIIPSLAELLAPAAPSVEASQALSALGPA